MKTIPLNSIVIFLIIILPTLVFARQGRGGERNSRDREKIETHKIAFITEKLELTPEEAEKFWPVYNSNRKKVEKEQKAFKEKNGYNPDGILSLTGQEANDFLEAQLEHNQKMVDMKKKFYTNLLDILSPQKNLRLFEAEKEFRIALMRRVAGNEKGRRR